MLQGSKERYPRISSCLQRLGELHPEAVAAQEKAKKGLTLLQLEMMRLKLKAEQAAQRGADSEGGRGGKRGLGWGEGRDSRLLLHQHDLWGWGCRGRGRGCQGKGWGRVWGCQGGPARGGLQVRLPAHTGGVLFPCTALHAGNGGILHGSARMCLGTPARHTCGALPCCTPRADIGGVLHRSADMNLGAPTRHKVQMYLDGKSPAEIAATCGKKPVKEKTVLGALLEAVKCGVKMPRERLARDFGLLGGK